MEYLTMIYEFLLALVVSYWPVIPLLIAAVIFREMEDECMKNHWTGKLEKWNTENTWTNKWAAPWPQPYKRKWYYLWYKPKHKERFAFSSTLLVFLTDPEHWFQFLMWRCLDAAVFLIDWKAGIVFFVSHVTGSFIKEVFIKQIK